jgi:hypothetical protein
MAGTRASYSSFISGVIKPWMPPKSFPRAGQFSKNPVLN